MGQIIKQFNYRGTKISSIQEPLQNKTIIFDYDYRGRRIKKLNQTANDLVEYYYDENLLIREKHSNYSLNFLYNENNELIGFEHISSNNSVKTKYFYLRNAFNDIVEILDVNGNSLVHYLYDAFGNTIEIIDNSSNSLATINPFRYRGYYYDVETGLFMMGQRYYSSELCRFIQPDDIKYLDPSSINGLNLYCYCFNNPIMYYDPTGYFPWLLLAAVLLFTPVGGTALQVAASVLSYAVMGIWALGDLVFNNGKGAWADMCSINWNPFNTDESATLNSNYVSFYKGAPVFRTNMSRSGSFSIIFLSRGSSENDLRHERGHNSQLMMMGIANYGLGIGIPSLFMFGPWAAQGGDNYYRAPWEITADILGGVSRPVHSQEDMDYGWWYLQLLIGFH